MSPADLRATVKIDDGAGSFIVINESDFNASEHTLYTEVPVEAEIVASPVLEEEPAVKPSLRKRS